jgi:hypothetical protein
MERVWDPTEAGEAIGGTYLVESRGQPAPTEEHLVVELEDGERVRLGTNAATWMTVYPLAEHGDTIKITYRPSPRTPFSVIWRHGVRSSVPRPA